MENGKNGISIILLLLLIFTLFILTSGCTARRIESGKPQPAPPPMASKPPETSAPSPSIKPPAPASPPEKKEELPRPSVSPSYSESLTLMKPEEVPALLDDLDSESLLAAIDKSLLFYNRVPSESRYPLGESTCTAGELKDTLLALREILKNCGTDECRKTKILSNFDFYKAAGRDRKGTVLFTGYFQPVLQGSLEKSDAYPFPLYAPPEETVVIHLGKFGGKYEGETLTGRISNGEVLPHYTREEIDGKKILQGRNLEIAWVADPVELFFMHIQGSGIMELPDGRTVRVGYARSNGHPFRGLAKVLRDRGKLSDREMSHEAVKNWLLDHPVESAEMMHQNPSYVFFRIMNGDNVGSHNVPLTAGRSIATDPRHFPKGAPALIRLRKPAFSEDHSVDWVPFSRFVLNQDAGGAIKGAGRVDLYCGTGVEAEQFAGSIKEEGELYFILKKRNGSGNVAKAVY